VTGSFDVIVAGAGPIGAATARELALAGRRVLLLDPGGELGQAWKAAAGMLAPQIEARPDDPLLDLGLAAREFYRPLATVLRETTGIDIGLWEEGIAAVAATEAEATELRARCAWQRQQGHLTDWLDADEVKVRWPWLGPTQGALWAPREGSLDPGQLVEALVRDTRRLGGVIETDAVIGLETRGDRIVGVVGRRGRYSGEHVVVAAGAWSAGIEGLPRPLAVAPVRGQMAALPWPGRARRAIIFGHGCYMMARGEEAIVGSTMEYAGFRSEVTSAGLARIFSGATALCPALDRAEVRRTWAGLRPASADGNPIIGPEPHLQGLWYATGHGRNGILLAGITGQLVRQLICGEPPGEDLAACAPERFWAW